MYVCLQKQKCLQRQLLYTRLVIWIKGRFKTNLNEIAEFGMWAFQVMLDLFRVGWELCGLSKALDDLIGCFLDYYFVRIFTDFSIFPGGLNQIYQIMNQSSFKCTPHGLCTIRCQLLIAFRHWIFTNGILIWQSYYCHVFLVVRAASKVLNEWSLKIVQGKRTRTRTSSSVSSSQHCNVTILLWDLLFWIWDYLLWDL